MSQAERNPPSTAPTMKPFVTIIIVAMRLRRGLYSPTSAVAFGMIAPRPSPARKRIASSSGIERAWAVSSVKTPNAAVAASRTGRRPIRSASIPNASEPANSPASPAPNTGPSAALGSPHARASAGAA